MSPLQPIDLNSNGWGVFNDRVAEHADKLEWEPPTDEESASESDDVNQAFQLPGRAAVNVHPDAFESDESSEGTPLAEIALTALDRDMDGVVCTPGKRGASVWSCVNTSLLVNFY